MPTNHVTIWIDHKEAHLIYFDPTKNELVKSKTNEAHLHHKKNSIGSGKAPVDHQFFGEIMSAISEVSKILIVGPGSAKVELLKHAIAHNPLVANKIIGIETVDHLTDGQILAYAKQYFNRIDQLNGV